MDISHLDTSSIYEIVGVVNCTQESSPQIPFKGGAWGNASIPQVFIHVEEFRLTC